MAQIKKLIVIDYGAGNLRSVVRALSHVGADVTVTSEPSVVQTATAIVFPGVGATQDTMRSLERLGLDTPLRQAVAAGVPLLGVCVGMQVLLQTSEEFGPHACLGIVEGTVRRLPGGQKVPQIGWNQVQYADAALDHPLFVGIPNNSDFYFVHSYVCDIAEPHTIAATTQYGMSFPSALIRDNLAAVQFHPEKSGQWGLRMYANFLTWAASLTSAAPRAVAQHA